MSKKFWVVVVEDKNHPVWKMGYFLCAIGALAITVNTFDMSELKTIGTWLLMGSGLKAVQVAGKKYLGGNLDS